MFVSERDVVYQEVSPQTDGIRFLCYCLMKREIRALGESKWWDSRKRVKSIGSFDVFICIISHPDGILHLPLRQNCGCCFLRLCSCQQKQYRWSFVILRLLFAQMFSIQNNHHPHYWVQVALTNPLRKYWSPTGKWMLRIQDRLKQERSCSYWAII